MIENTPFVQREVNMSTRKSEYTLDRNTLFRRYVENYANFLLQWDLEDLNNDVNQLKHVIQDRFEIPVSERIRFSWRGKLQQQTTRYEELVEMGKLFGKRTTPWEFFWYPLRYSDTTETSKAEDKTLKKLQILDRWISIYWSDCASSYIFGKFPATILLCASCVELMADGVALRDNQAFYEQIKGKTGYKKFKPFPFDDELKSLVRELFESRGQIIAHPILILEKLHWDISEHKTEWDETVPSSQFKGQELYEFKGLAKQLLDKSMRVLSRLEGISLRNQS